MGGGDELPAPPNDNNRDGGDSKSCFGNSPSDRGVIRPSSFCFNYFGIVIVGLGTPVREALSTLLTNRVVHCPERMLYASEVESTPLLTAGGDL